MHSNQYDTRWTEEKDQFLRRHYNRDLSASQKAAIRASQDGSRMDMVLLAKQFKRAEDRYVNILLKEMSNA